MTRTRASGRGGNARSRMSWTRMGKPWTGGVDWHPVNYESKIAAWTGTTGTTTVVLALALPFHPQTGCRPGGRRNCLVFPFDAPASRVRKVDRDRHRRMQVGCERVGDLFDKGCVMCQMCQCPSTSSERVVHEDGKQISTIIIGTPFRRHGNAGWCQCHPDNC